MRYTKDGEAEESTMKKYQSLMDQLRAFADWKGFRYLREHHRSRSIETARKQPPILIY